MARRNRVDGVEHIKGQMTLQELFSDPKRWTQWEFASGDGEGMCWLDPNDPKAVKWCLIGGVHKCYKDGRKRNGIFKRILKKTGVRHATDWNDKPERTIEDVQKLVKELNI